jgi:phospholipid/cholesterol/gamma-HCH transport system substrate-binding protein
MNRSIIETLLGAAVLLVAGYFLFFAYQHSDVGRGGAGYPLKATFERVNGLALGADVRISGIKVGTISDMQLDTKTFLATLTLNLKNNIALSDDTVAEITSDGLFGGSYLALNPGGSDKTLKAGDVLTYTQSPATFSELITKFMLSSKDDKDKDQKTPQP